MPIFPNVAQIIQSLRAEPTPSDGAPWPAVADAWINTASGQGVQGIDKAASTSFRRSALVSRSTLSALYQTGGIAGKIVDMPVWDSVRNGWTVETEPDAQEALDAALDALDLRVVYSRARKWARLYGSAIVVAGLDDVMRVEDLALRPARYERLKWLEPYAAGVQGQVYAERGDPARPAKVTMWVVTPPGSASTLRVHPDRVWVMDGVEMPPEIAVQSDHWGDSVLQRCWESLSRVATADAAGVTWLAERQYPVWKIKNLKGMLSKDPGGLVGPRFQAIALGKSIWNAIILDHGLEEFDVVQTSAAGIDTLLNIYPNRVAAVSNIPVTRLYGTSPGGLNATGESDIRGYYDFIEGGEQAENLVPFLDWVTGLVLRGDAGPSTGGALKWTVKPTPLYSPTAAEEATTRATNAATDNTYLLAQVLGPDEVRQSRFGATTYGADIVLAATVETDDTVMDDGELEAEDVEVPPIPLESAKPLMTGRETAEYLRVSPGTVRKWTKSGALPVAGKKGASGYLYRIEDLAEWLVAGATPDDATGDAPDEDAE